MPSSRPSSALSDGSGSRPSPWATPPRATSERRPFSTESSPASLRALRRQFTPAIGVYYNVTVKAYMYILLGTCTEVHA